MSEVNYKRGEMYSVFNKPENMYKRGDYTRYEVLECINQFDVSGSSKETKIVVERMKARANELFIIEQGKPNFLHIGLSFIIGVIATISALLIIKYYF